MELILVRHGITAQNAARVFMGHDPVPLSPEGRGQITRLAGRLREIPFSRLVTSDIARARESADIIAAVTGHVVEEAPALREIDVGEAKGMSYSDAASKWPEVFAPEAEARFPGGESFADVADRSSAWLRREVLAGAGERTVVVCHGGVVRGAGARLLGIPLVMVAGFQVDNASLTVLRTQGSEIGLITWNDVAHLGPAHRSAAGRSLVGG